MIADAKVGLYNTSNSSKNKKIKRKCIDNSAGSVDL